MSPDDRDILSRLRAEKEELQQALGRLESRLGELEERVGVAAALPPIPVGHDLPPVPFELPPIPLNGAGFHPTDGLPLPPLPVSSEISRATPLPANRPPLEFRLGGWLFSIGVLFLIAFFVALAVHLHLGKLLGPWGEFGVFGAVSVAVAVWGQRLELRDKPRAGWTMLALGLGALYFTFYAASGFGAWHIVPTAFLSGVLLLIWSGLALFLSARQRSPTLAFIALGLAFFGAALNPSQRFTLAADLLLAGTVVLFFLRFGWTSLLSLGLAGTYLAMLRRLIFNGDNELVLDTSQALSFAPHVVYLVAAWGVFTAAVLLASRWQGPGRLAFLTINNILGVASLLLTATISGYGSERSGSVLLVSGLVLLGTAGLARRLATGLAGAYAAQSLLVLTLGWLAWASGLGRDLVLLFATLFLGLAGITAARRIAAEASWILALITTVLLLWAIGFEGRDPWLLGIGGGAVMLKLAWWWRAREGSPTLAWPGSLYGALGLALIAACLAMQLSASSLPIWLALIALAGTWIGYAVRWSELPPISQILLLAAQGLVLFHTENGEPLSAWSTFWVTAGTLLSILTFQRVRRGRWLRSLDVIYAFALVGFAAEAIADDGASRMVGESLFAAAFLIFGALTRVWSVAVFGQLFLVLAVWQYFSEPLPDAWSAMLVLAVVYATGRGVHGWLRAFPGLVGTPRQLLRGVAYLYQLLALVMLVLVVVERIPRNVQPAIFLLMGTLVLSLNVQRSRTFGVRASYVLSGLGTLLCFTLPAHELGTAVNAVAVLSFLTQPAILSHAVRPLGKAADAWLLILASSITGWVYASALMVAHFGAGAVTMGWAAFALVLFVLGVLLHERRQRWCALGILLAGMFRVFLVDLRERSHGYWVLSFIVLALITLGLGSLYARHARRSKTTV